MIETLSWEEVAGNPDKYVQLLSEREQGLQGELSTLQEELRLVRQLSELREESARLRTSGFPGQRGANREHADTGFNSDGTPPSTRKSRIMNLIAQDPQRLWKVRDVADALGEESKIKSIRVAMDQLTKSGSLSKLPNAYYQFVQLQEN